MINQCLAAVLRVAMRAALQVAVPKVEALQVAVPRVAVRRVRVNPEVIASSYQ